MEEALLSFSSSVRPLPRHFLCLLLRKENKCAHCWQILYLDVCGWSMEEHASKKTKQNCQRLLALAENYCKHFYAIKH